MIMIFFRINSAFVVNWCFWKITARNSQKNSQGKSSSCNIAVLHRWPRRWSLNKKYLWAEFLSLSSHLSQNTNESNMKALTNYNLVRDGVVYCLLLVELYFWKSQNGFWVIHVSCKICTFFHCHQQMVSSF